MTLYYINFTLILFLLLLSAGPNRFTRVYKNLSLFVTLGIWLYSLNLWLNCSWYSGSFTFMFEVLHVFNIQCLWGLDTLSLFFIILTTFIFPFCILAVWDTAAGKFLFFNLVLIELFLILTFSVFDLLLFCLFFEAILIPMFFIILWYGSRIRRIQALTYFFLYTLLGSLFLFLALFILYFEVGSTSFFSVYAWGCVQKLVVSSIYVINAFWGLLFLVFAIKVPIFPFHIWLPEAHVEAPTVGSVILAGLLLKLGGYGVLRFLYIFKFSLVYWQPVSLFLVVFSIWLASISAVRQLDLKRTIAYSSIAHMNFALTGFFSNQLLGMVGGFSLLLSHGFVSAALFLLIGFLYDRYHTRTIPYYGGLVQVMPIWVFFFFIFIISNFSFPGTSNFIGEVFIFFALAEWNVSFVLLVVVGISTLITVVYSLFLFNRVSFGSLKMQYIKSFSDLTRREVYIMVPLFIVNIVFGIFPNFFLGPVYQAVVIYMADSINLFDTRWMFETNKPSARLDTYLSTEDRLAVDATIDILDLHVLTFQRTFQNGTYQQFFPAFEQNDNVGVWIENMRVVVYNQLMSFYNGAPSHIYEQFNCGHYAEDTFFYWSVYGLYELIAGYPADERSYFMLPIEFFAAAAGSYGLDLDELIVSKPGNPDVTFQLLSHMPQLKEILIIANPMFGADAAGFNAMRKHNMAYDFFIRGYYIQSLKTPLVISYGSDHDLVGQ